MSPLFYAAIALAFDLLNLVHSTPNFVKSIAHVMDPILNPGKGGIPPQAWIKVGAYAALPGLVWMAVTLLMLRRVLKQSNSFSGGELPGRNPDLGNLAERRFCNVVQEMALAASQPAPRVLVVEDGGLNAAAFGADEQHVTILIAKGLLDQLNREQLQGIAAHLIGSIANGDMAIGLRAATTLSLFSFLARFDGILVDKKRGRMLLRMAVALLRPTSAGSRALIEELMNAPRESQAAPASRQISPRTQMPQQTWRDYIWLPLTGPVVITGFLSRIVQMLVLGPLVSLVWRQRKYMADATAVRLTRDPDTLAGALQAMSRGLSQAPFASTVAHLAVVSPSSGMRGQLGGTLVSMYPDLGRRLQALQRMGAHVTYTPKRVPLLLLLIGIPLGLLLGGLMALAVFLLAYVSLPISALFLGIPFGLLHMLLRWHSG
jgi:Zn-dependent protease with chaperone function